jgi:hypothetical protein
MKRLVQVLLLAAWLAGVLPGGAPQGPSARDPDVLRASDPVRVVADTDLVRLTVERTRIRLVVGPRDWATWRVSVSRPDVLSATTAPTARSPATPPQPD